MVELVNSKGFAKSFPKDQAEKLVRGKSGWSLPEGSAFYLRGERLVKRSAPAIEEPAQDPTPVQEEPPKEEVNKETTEAEDPSDNS